MMYEPNLWYAPEKVCRYCHRTLCAIKKNNYKVDPLHPMKYVRPAVWLSLDEHDADKCYFCLNFPKIYGHRYETREEIDYENVESVMPAVYRSPRNPHSQSEMREEIDFVANAPDSANEVTEMSHLSASAALESNYEPSRAASEDKTPQLITQSKFDDLVRDLGLHKEEANCWLRASFNGIW